MERYTFVDTLRGLAACWVLLFHLNEVGRFAPSFYQSFVKHGWLGVPAFFVISGFSVQLSASRSESASSLVRRRF
jgi:peptidoglycan/LPS O-acetylase OafA/YrhL